MDYSVLLNLVGKQSQSIGFALPTQSNASFEGYTVQGGYVPQGQYGNPRPGAKTVITILARVYPQSLPQSLLQAGVDVNLIYYEGVLVSPKTYSIPKDWKTKATINSLNGEFQFLPLNGGALSHLTGVRQYLGQRIAGTFKIA